MDTHSDSDRLARDLGALAAALERSWVLRDVPPADREGLALAVSARVVEKYPQASAEERLAIAQRAATREWLRLLTERRRRRALSPAALAGLASSAPEPSSAAESSELRAALLRSLVADLEPLERRIILDRFFRGRTLQDIADSIDLSLSATHRLVAQALTRLHHSLADHEDLI